MKIQFFILIILINTLTTKASKYNKSLVETNSKNRFYQLVERRMKDLMQDRKFLDNVKSRIANFGRWLRSEENRDSFVGRCFGVARQIRIAMPIIMLKLGIIVTILVFLTLFSMKTMGLILMLFMLGTSNLIAKFSLWTKGNSEYKYQRPQSVHFHIHQSKNGDYSFPSASAYSKIDQVSPENLNSNQIETDEEFREKLNLLAAYHPYYTARN